LYNHIIKTISAVAKVRGGSVDLDVQSLMAEHQGKGGKELSKIGQGGFLPMVLRSTTPCRVGWQCSKKRIMRSSKRSLKAMGGE
jgi:hypothetical protein